jgi:hypothetical protein
MVRSRLQNFFDEQLATKNFAQSVLDVGTVVSIGDGIAPEYMDVKHASLVN